MTGLIIATVALLGIRDIEWFLLKRSLYVQFQDAGWLERDELQSWITDTKRVRPIVFDLRGADAWNVSHLPGALPLDVNAAPENLGLARDTPIVSYDEVGFRSAKFSRRLRAAGFAKTYVLDGGIFSWANDRRPLEADDGSKATRVYPFNAVWAKLLRDDVRAETPR